MVAYECCRLSLHHFKAATSNVKECTCGILQTLVGFHLLFLSLGNITGLFLDLIHVHLNVSEGLDVL